MSSESRFISLDPQYKWILNCVTGLFGQSVVKFFEVKDEWAFEKTHGENCLEYFTNGVGSKCKIIFDKDNLSWLQINKWILLYYMYHRVYQKKKKCTIGISNKYYGQTLLGLYPSNQWTCHLQQNGLPNVHSKLNVTFD